MLPRPHPPSIPGLFQIPPPLESDPPPFAPSTPYPSSHSHIQHPTTRSSFAPSPSAARHDHSLTFAGQISSYPSPLHADHYTQQAPSASPASLQAPASARPSPFSPSSRPTEYVQSDRAMNQNPYPTHQHHPQHPWPSASHPTPHPTHAGGHAPAYAIQRSFEADIAVKYEQSAEEHPGMWSHEASQIGYDAHPHAYYCDAVDEEMHECKEEHAEEGGFDSSSYAVEYPQHAASPRQGQHWNDAVPMYASPPHALYIAIPDYTTSYDDGVSLYAESPASALPAPAPAPQMPQMHTYPSASLHKILPARTVATRSYTLEGAITPLSPKPQPVLPPRAASPPHLPVPSKRKTQSPPPMDYLRPPPTPPPSHPSSSPGPIASGSGSGPGFQAPSHSHAHASVYETASPSSPPSDSQGPLVQKRPRGRPRKDKQPQRAVSPPVSAPVVDYPFPDVPSATTATAPGQAMFKLNMTMGVGADGGEGGGLGAGTGVGGEGGKEPEKKKPIMACLFCRERKIACGPPAPGGPQRCNQCTRRGLVCEYPKESRRGQHKRGARAARVEALAAGAIKPKPKPKVDTTAKHAQAQAQAPTSPLTPLPSPLPHAHGLPSGSTSGGGSGSGGSSGSVTAGSPTSAKAAEKKGRADKEKEKTKDREREREKEKERGAKGKERAAQKQRLRAVNASGSVGEGVGHKGGGALDSAGGGGGGFGFAPSSELAMVGMAMGMGPGPGPMG